MTIGASLKHFHSTLVSLYFGTNNQPLNNKIRVIMVGLFACFQALFDKSFLGKKTGARRRLFKYINQYFD